MMVSKIQSERPLNGGWETVRNARNVARLNRMSRLSDFAGAPTRDLDTGCNNALAVDVCGSCGTLATPGCIVAWKPKDSGKPEAVCAGCSPTRRYASDRRSSGNCGCSAPIAARALRAWYVHRILGFVSHAGYGAATSRTPQISNIGWRSLRHRRVCLRDAANVRFVYVLGHVFGVHCFHVR